MGRRAKQADLGMRDKRAYFMCKRKRKFKSSEASHQASRFGQRKYECPICGHWHLTKTRRDL